MRKVAGFLAFAMVLSSLPAPAAAGGHLAARSAVESALRDAAQTRTRDGARLNALLATDAAAETAARLGIGITDVRRAAARLSDAERQEILARAEAMAADPVAGYMDPDIKQLLTILLIVLIVVVVLSAID